LQKEIPLSAGNLLGKKRLFPSGNKVLERSERFLFPSGNKVLERSERFLFAFF
jgi:hypothetical protein